MRGPICRVQVTLSDGRRFRILAVVDDFTRECLALVADTSLSGTRVARELDALVIRRGKPVTIISDNGTELTSTAILSLRRPEHHIGNDCLFVPCIISFMKEDLLLSAGMSLPHFWLQLRIMIRWHRSGKGIFSSK